MTPTLFGRWQTRLLLMTTIGTLTTLPFALGYLGLPSGMVYFWVLGYITLLGLGWDYLYDRLQKFRWDRDWPGILQLLAGIWEALFLLSLVNLADVPGVPKTLSIVSFILHYGTVWLAVYTVSQTLTRILLPRWRFNGGQLF